MNERIKLLAEQADIDFFNSTDPEFFGRVYCEAWTEQQQKFAELIVKECARVVDNLTEQDNPIEYRRTYAQGADVLEHFGVEA